MTLNKLLEILEPLKDNFGEMEIQIDMFNILDFEDCYSGDVEEVILNLSKKLISFTHFRK